MTRPLVKRIDMALHVQELCAEHDITIKYQSLNDTDPRYYANPRHKLICIRPTKNTGFYVSALHEIGHLIGPLHKAEIMILWRKRLVLGSMPCLLRLYGQILLLM